ncbi:hypothetical protein [Methylobacterium platani]|uniref:AsmA-like C-terminal domain-containing protein n=2 Tax=Methylobacterium platani TaxID=427683 RepID=A0A179RZA8_9HYPH|nr:hypothetical protein [Methylobacterium platani]KMO22164.1 hypothetical protein SQ03_01280 [Methylobacterium platani JCM 14648]OAS17300.1 hypothetical protein A5481_27670 [Methylobacterium platani]
MTRSLTTGVARAALGVLACATLAAGLPAAVPLLAGPALAQGSPAQDATVALDEVVIPLGPVTLKAPKLELRGTGLSRDEVRAILDPAGPAPWRTRLDRLSAREIVIPVLRVEQPAGGRVQVAVYHDVVARDVSAGRIGTLEAGGATLTVEGPGPDAAGAYGRLSAREIDLPGLARLFTEAGGPDAAPIRLYGGITAEDIALTGPDGTAFRIARIDARDLTGRPTTIPWGETARALSEAGAKGDAKPAAPERARMAGLAADLLDGIGLGGLEISGITLAAPGGPGARPMPVQASLARLTYAPETGTGLVKAEGLAVDAPAGRVALKGLSLSGLSLKPMLEGLRRAAAGPLDPAEMRRYAPSLGMIALQDLDVDLPAQAAKDSPPAGDPMAASGPVRFAVRKANLAMSEPRDGVPTASRLAVDGFTCAVPPGTTAPVLSDLAGLGYTALDLSGQADIRWDEAAREVTVRDVTLTGKDMGTARITGTIGGIGKEVFDPEPMVSSLALLGATAKSLGLTLENGGLFQRFVDQQAKAQSLKPEELQREYGTAAMLGIPAVLGGSPSAKALGQAVSRFVVKPGRLSVSAAAKDPAGLGLMDFSTAPSPGKIFDRLTVDATAE